MKEQIEQFYIQPEISREMPGKSEVVMLKKGGEKIVARDTISRWLEQAHQRFCETYPEMKIGRTAFKKLKPENVMSKSEINKAIMCAHPNGSLPNMPCDNRACKNCEMKPVELLQPLADYRDESLKWYVWEYVWLLKKGEKKRITSCVEKTTTVANRPRKPRLNMIQ